MATGHSSPRRQGRTGSAKTEPPRQEKNKILYNLAAIRDLLAAATYGEPDGQSNGDRLLQMLHERRSCKHSAANFQ